MNDEAGAIVLAFFSWARFLLLWPCMDNLEYIRQTASKVYVNSVQSSDGLKYHLTDNVVDIYKQRLNDGLIQIHPKAKARYYENDELKQMLAYWGIDIDKFWNLSVWAFDYVMTLNQQLEKSVKEEVAELVGALLNADEAELILKVKNGKQVKISSPKTLSLISSSLGMLYCGSDKSSLDFKQFGGDVELSETYQVRHFYEIMHLFMETTEKAGLPVTTQSVSKDFIIAKMVYILGLSGNAKYMSEPNFLRTATNKVDLNKYLVYSNIYL